MKSEDINETKLHRAHGKSGLFFMPMRACNAPTTFQNLIKKIFRVYVDAFAERYIAAPLMFSYSIEKKKSAHEFEDFSEISASLSATFTTWKNASYF